MNIGEALATATVLREAGLLKGEARSQVSVEKLAEDVHYLCQRAGKVLGVTLTPAIDVAEGPLWKSMGEGS